MEAVPSCAFNRATPLDAIDKRLAGIMNQTQRTTCCARDILPNTRRNTPRASHSSGGRCHGCHVLDYQHRRQFGTSLPNPDKYKRSLGQRKVLYPFPLDDEAFIDGILLVLFGPPFAIAFGLGIFWDEKPWHWVYGIVLICISLTSCCCFPVSIPLLIYWLKPETKSYFNPHEKSGPNR